MTTELALNRSLVLQDKAFWGNVGRSSAGAVFSHVQLLNPSGSGKRLQITDLLVAFLDLDDAVVFSAGVTLSALSVKLPVSKCGLVSGLSVAELRSQNNATTLGTTEWGNIPAKASQASPVPLDKFPVILRPGDSLIVSAATPQNGIAATIHWLEFD